MPVSRIFSCHQTWVGSVLLAVIMGPLGGCARNQPLVEFPTLRALQRIAERPAAVPAVTAGKVPPLGWTVDGAHAAHSTQDLWSPGDDWGRAFVQTVQAQGGTSKLTRAMACVARELGRFRLQQGAAPPPILGTFLRGACGAVTAQAGTLSLSGTVDASVTDSELLAQWRDQLRTHLVAQIPTGATDVGFWFGRGGGQALATVVYAQDPHTIQPFSLLAGQNGTVTIEGRIHDSVDHVEGYINQGRFGVESCLVDPGVAPPQFRVVCPMAPQDQTAWVQLLYAQPKRVLTSLFLETLVRRGAGGELSYVEPSLPESGSLSSEKIGFSQAVVAELNGVRAQAKLGPVQLAAEQSETASRVAGHYFAAAQSGRRDAQMDEIALGLLAGWQVEGMIRGGSFFAQHTQSGETAARWLQSALALPAGRSALLAPAVERVAIGPLSAGEEKGMAALVTGYELYHGNEHKKDARRILDRLNFARQRAGLPPAIVTSGMEALMEKELGRVHAGEDRPAVALHEVLQGAAEHWDGGAGGYVLETMSLDGLQIPQEILQRPQLQVAIGVTHQRPAGSAWAQYAILIVYAQSAPPGA